MTFLLCSLVYTRLPVGGLMRRLLSRTPHPSRLCGTNFARATNTLRRRLRLASVAAHSELGSDRIERKNCLYIPGRRHPGTRSPPAPTRPTPPSPPLPSKSPNASLLAKRGTSARVGEAATGVPQIGRRHTTGATSNRTYKKRRHPHPAPWPTCRPAPTPARHRNRWSHTHTIKTGNHTKGAVTTDRRRECGKGGEVSTSPAAPHSPHTRCSVVSPEKGKERLKKK